MKLIASLLLCLILAGCYENVGQKIERDEMEKRIHDLERKR